MDLIVVYSFGAVFAVTLYSAFRLQRPFSMGRMLGLQSVSVAAIAACFVFLSRPEFGERPKTFLLLALCAFGALNIIFMARMLSSVNQPKWVRAMSLALGAASLLVLAFWVFVAYRFITGMGAG